MCGLSSVVQPFGPSHWCPGPSHWRPGSSVWHPKWSLGPPGWGVIISGRRNGWLCSGPGLGIRNSHTRVHPTLHQGPHGHEINQSSLVDRSRQWWEQKTADIRQHGWVLSCSWRVPCWSTMGHRTIHNCWAVHCQVLMVCWAGHTCRVVIIKCWAVPRWLLTCCVGNFLWIIHDVRLKGLRAVLEGFVVTMHKGAYETRSHIPRALARGPSSAGPSLAGSSSARPSLAGPSPAGPSTASVGPVTLAGSSTSAADSSTCFGLGRVSERITVMVLLSGDWVMAGDSCTSRLET